MATKQKPTSTPPKSDDGAGPDDEPEILPAPKAKTTPEPETPAKPKHSSRLLAAAAEFGYSEADLEDFDSDTIWDEIRKQTELRATSRQRAPEPAPKPKDEPEDEDEAYLAALKTEGYTDTFIAAERKKLARLKAAEVKAARVDQLEAAEKTRAAASINDTIDSAFTGLGKKYEQLVGTDPISDLTDPGQLGWRNAIVREAKLLTTDSKAAIAKKIAAAAAKLAKGRVADEEDDEVAAGYQPEVEPARKPKAKDPATGRFTVEDFANGHVQKPSGKKTGLAGLDAVEGVRQMLRANGDPRGYRSAVVEIDDDLPD